MRRLLILPSPFLGTAAYAPLAAALRGRGAAATVATYDEPPSPADVVERWAEQAAREDREDREDHEDHEDHEGIVLVAHSNAGYLAPAVAARLGGRPIVFLDAALPSARGATALAPAAFRDTLAALADADGLLPPWTRWWPPEELSDVLPDGALEGLDAVVPRVPLAYVEGSAPVPDGWEAGPCAYVAFGEETYAEELGRARSRGWPVRVLDGARHLHCVVAPDETARGLLDLLSSPRR